MVAAENEYGNVASQVGGRYVRVTSVESKPNTDPHTYEVSPEVAQEISGAQVLVENGVGYDSFMSRIAAASPHSSRRVIDVANLLGVGSTTSNPHLWYSPTTMPRVANALAGALAHLQPGHAAYFRSKASAFIASLGPWTDAITRLRSSHAGTAVATTEPVADYLLEAAGIHNLTPLGFQADVMNGVDPSPQDVSFETTLLTRHRVKVLVYNQQVTDSLTRSLVSTARKAGIPVVGAYETMPTPGYTYQSWMLAETVALQRAVAHRASTARL